MVAPIVLLQFVMLYAERFGSEQVVDAEQAAPSLVTAAPSVSRLQESILQIRVLQGLTGIGERGVVKVATNNDGVRAFFHRFRQQVGLTVALHRIALQGAEQAALESGSGERKPLPRHCLWRL